MSADARHLGRWSRGHARFPPTIAACNTATACSRPSWCAARRRVSSKRTWRGWRAAARGSESISQAWEALRAEIARMAGQAPPLAILKIIVTRGSGPRRGYAPHGALAPRRVLMLFAAPADARGVSRQASRYASLRCVWPRTAALAGLKHLNRLENVLAASEPGHAEHFESLLLDARDQVVCGTMSNVFVVRGGAVDTARRPLRRRGRAARDGAARSAGAWAFPRKSASLTLEDADSPQTRCSSPMRASELCRARRVGEHRFPHEGHRAASCAATSRRSMRKLLLALGSLAAAGGRRRGYLLATRQRHDAAPRARIAQPVDAGGQSRRHRCARCSPSSTQRGALADRRAVELQLRVRGWPQIKSGRYDIPAAREPRRKSCASWARAASCSRRSPWSRAGPSPTCGARSKRIRASRSRCAARRSPRSWRRSAIRASIRRAGSSPTPTASPQAPPTASSALALSQDGRGARRARGRSAPPDLPLANAYQALMLASIVEKETGLAERAAAHRRACSSRG